jgi:hypothetical protein
MLELIGRMVPQRLRSIVVKHGGAVGIMESHTRNFFQALEAHCASALLTSIHVAQTCTHLFEGTYFEDYSEMDYTISAFEPLLSFQNFR